MKITQPVFIYYFALTAVIVAFFTILQFVPSRGFSDPDGFYHAGAARLISEGRLGASFPWANFSTLRDHYGDQHYLYHLLLIPMSSITGMHVSVVIFSTLMVLVFVWLLRRLEVPHAWLWGLFLLGSSMDFLFRINVVKANTLSLVLLFGAVWLLAKQKYWWLLPLSALFVWVYGGFVFLPAVAGLYVVANWVIARQLDIRPVLAVIIGIAIGLLLHPHFPQIAVHLYYQMFHSGLGAGIEIPVGGEWRPYGLTDLITANGLAVLTFIMASAIVIVEFGRLRSVKSREGVLGLFLWLTGLFFLTLTIRSRRFVEYSAPFCILFAAYVVARIVQSSAYGYLKQMWKYWHVRLFTLLLGGIIVLTASFNISRVEDWLKNGTDPEALRGAGEWLSQNTAPGEIIFNTKWDDLPQLFYWDSKNYYIIGLDPTFLYAYDHDLYWKWRQLADNDPEKFNNSYDVMRTILHKDFHSSYIVLENGRDEKLKSFLDLESAGQAELEYKDNYASVYKIN